MAFGGGCRLGRKHIIADGSFSYNVIMDEDGWKSVVLKGRCTRCKEIITKCVKVASGTPVSARMLED